MVYQILITSRQFDVHEAKGGQKAKIRSIAAGFEPARPKPWDTIGRAFKSHPLTTLACYHDWTHFATNYCICTAHLLSVWIRCHLTQVDTLLNLDTLESTGLANAATDQSNRNVVSYLPAEIHERRAQVQAPARKRDPSRRSPVKVKGKRERTTRFLWSSYKPLAIFLSLPFSSRSMVSTAKQ